MRILDLLTMIVTGLMVGNEVAVSAFVNPAIWKHSDRAQASTLAGSLGSVMPGWYALGLLLLLAEAILRRHTAEAYLYWTASGLWAAVIVFTVTALVPLNNRLARTSVEDTGFDWLALHHRWDTRHRVRIAFLTLAFACFVWAALPR